MEIIMTCPLCRKQHSVVVDMFDYMDYLDGELVQNAFPYLNATQREQIISDLCPACQEKIFKEF